MPPMLKLCLLVCGMEAVVCKNGSCGTHPDAFAATLAIIRVDIGQIVARGQEIAHNASFISAGLHAPISGTVVSIGDIPHLNGKPARAMVIKASEDDHTADTMGREQYWSAFAAVDNEHFRSLAHCEFYMRGEGGSSKSHDSGACYQAPDIAGIDAFAEVAVKKPSSRGSHISGHRQPPCHHPRGAAHVLSTGRRETEQGQP